MAHLPPHSLFLLFLAVHGFVACHGSPLPPSSTYNDSICSESFRCGDVDIKYPFYLSDATGTTPDYTSNFSCGYTDLKIFCHVEGGIKTPILPLGKDKYTILNISYANRTIILGDTEALASGSKCPAVNHNVTFSREWLNYADSLGELTFFYGCSPQPDIEDHQIDCIGFNPPAGSADDVSFVFTSKEGKFSREHELAGDCSLVVNVPVQEKAPVRGGPLMWPRDYGGVLKQGFELEWKQNDKEQQCYQCERSGGRCAYGEKKAFLGCLCSGGKAGATDCNSSGGATSEYLNPPSCKFFTTGVSSCNFVPSCRFAGRQTQLRCVSPLPTHVHLVQLPL